MKAGSNRLVQRQAVVLALLASASASLSDAATAADLTMPKAPVYTKAAPIASPAYDWSGFYAGAHVGFDWGRARVVDNGVLTESAAPMNGAIGGLLAGVNWQNGQFVYGIEGDFGAAALRGHGTAPPPVAPDFVPNQYQVNLSGNIRGRLGVAVLPRTLIYAAGGLALAEFRFRENSGPVELSSVMTGWTAGAGIEQAFAHNLIGRVEYLYADYGQKDFTVAPGDIYNVGFKTHTIRAALVSKFDGDRGTSRGAMAMAGPVSNWSGLYIGGDIGGAFQHLDGTSNFFENDGTGGPIENNFRRQSGNGNTVAGGFHAGYNWQIAPSWLIGFEGDYQWMRPKYDGCRGTTVPGTECSNVGLVGFATIGGETRSIATVRGRVGATFDRIMVYGTGGVAFADVQTQLGMNCVSGCGIPSVPFANTVNFASVKTGWVAGAGVEWMLDPNWIVRAEYLRAGFGQMSDTINIPVAACNLSGPCGLSWSRDLHYDIVRAGISYKFGG